MCLRMVLGSSRALGSGSPTPSSLTPPSLVPFNTSVLQVKTGFALASCFQPAGVEAIATALGSCPAPPSLRDWETETPKGVLIGGAES